MLKTQKQSRTAVRPPAKTDLRFRKESAGTHSGGRTLGRSLSSVNAAAFEADVEDSVEQDSERGNSSALRTAGGNRIAPASVHRLLSSPGMPLSSSTKASLRGSDSEEQQAPSQSATPSRVSSGASLTVGPRDDHFEREAHSTARSGAAPSVDLDQVRIHTGPQANDAARSVNAAAFTVGSNIVFAQNQFQPETSSGRQTMMHELTHVGQQAFSGLSLQRVGFFESISRFFGGGTFSNDELRAYIEGLRGTNHIEDANDSDNKARAVVAANMHQAENPAIRALLIQEMLSGYLSGEDQAAIIKVLEDASADDRERIVTQTTLTTQVRRFDDDRRNRLNVLLGGVARHRADSVDTNWFIAHTIRGADDLQGTRLAVVVDSLDAQPAGEQQAHPVPGPPVASTNLTGSPVPLASNVSHPRSAGTGYVALHVAPVGPNGQPDLSPSSQSRSYSAPYQAISPDRRSVFATAHISLARQQSDVVSRTTGTERQTGVANQSGTSNTNTQESTAGSNASATNSQSQGASRTAENEVQRSQGTENSQTDTTTTTITLSGSTATNSGIQVSTTTDFHTDGRVLGLLLGLAGPEGIALYEFLNVTGALKDTKFNITRTSNDTFSTQVLLSQSTARAYSQSRTRTQRSGTSQTSRAGAGSHAEQGQSATVGTSLSQSNSTSQQQSNSTTTSSTDSTSQSSTRATNVFTPVIDQVALDFRVDS